MTKSKKPGIVFWATATTVLLFLAVGGYVAGYLRMVQAGTLVPLHW